jgi:hypothetical protein
MQRPWGDGEEGGSRMERGARTAGGRARTVTLAALELFLTIICPRALESHHLLNLQGF